VTYPSALVSWNPSLDLCALPIGVRSAKAVYQLQPRLALQVTNLQGGILAWADKIDPAMAKY